MIMGLYIQGLRAACDTPAVCWAQTLRGMQQAEQAGKKIKAAMDSDGQPYNLFFYTSPYKRSRQTHDCVRSCFSPDQLKGVQEEVQLREQDFGNFQVSLLALLGVCLVLWYVFFVVACATSS